MKIILITENHTYISRGYGAAGDIFYRYISIGYGPPGADLRI